MNGWLCGTLLFGRIYKCEISYIVTNSSDPGDVLYYIYGTLYIDGNKIGTVSKYIVNKDGSSKRIYIALDENASDEMEWKAFSTLFKPNLVELVQKNLKI